MLKGLAAMVAGKKDGAKEQSKAPSSDSKSAALKKVVEALQDGDVDGAAKALGVAISACQSEYKSDDEDGE